MSYFQPLALGGKPLEGERVVKFAYLDEAGIGGEPWVVVGGILIDPDKQWTSLRQYLDDMADYHLLSEDKPGYVFHAKDIFSGSRFFDKAKYPLKKRQEMLHDLCEIPALCGATIFVGIVDLLKYHASRPDRTKGKAISEAHRISYAICVCMIDFYMKSYEDKDELVTLVVENNNDARRHIKQMQKHLNSQELATSLGDHEMTRFLPVTKIVDVPHFVDKEDSPIMQIADVCAFVMMRHCCGLPHVDEYMKLIKPRIFTPPPPAQEA